MKKLLPESANFHFFKPCNYRCKHCFATFIETRNNDSLDKEDFKRIISLLKPYGVSKLNLTGGEPTIYPYIAELLLEARKNGLVVSMVTNGTNLVKVLETSYENIDWIGLSIDSKNEETNAKMGRGLVRDLREGKSNHYKISEPNIKLIKSKYPDIKIKINTVVTSYNINEKMFWINDLMPDRWKVFQFLPIDGQNDDYQNELLVSKEQFDSFKEIHQQIITNVKPVFETNELMLGSYAMIDSRGRFYQNITGEIKYSRPILEVGVEQAWNDIIFDYELFKKREGIYNWA